MAKQRLDPKDTFKDFGIDKEGFQSALRHAQGETFDLGHLFSGAHFQLKALISKVKLLFSLASDQSTPREKIHFLLKTIHSLFRKLDGSISHEKRRKREIDEEWRKEQENLAEEYLKKDQLEFEKEKKENDRCGWIRQQEAQASLAVAHTPKSSFSPAFQLFKQMAGYLRPRPHPKTDVGFEESILRP